jgi:hypothetical protein
MTPKWFAAGVGNFCFSQPRVLPEGSRGLSEFASDTPGRQAKKKLHPGGMPESNLFIMSTIWIGASGTPSGVPKP